MKAKKNFHKVKSNKTKNLKRKASTNNEVEKSKKRKTSSSHTSVNANEVNHLKNVEILHNSNIFRLQIQEMMKETSPNSTFKENMDNWIEKFNNWIKKIKTSKTYNSNELLWLKKKGIIYPLKTFPFDDQIRNFIFIPPTTSHVVGSYKIGSSIYPVFNVDLLIEIPKDCFLVTYWKNGRYIKLRSLYLCYLAHLIKKSPLVENVEFSFRNGDPLKLNLIITPKWDIKENIKIRLDVVPPTDYFKLNRFNPDKNNIRPEWLINEPFSCGNPYYNGTILMDLSAQRNDDMISEKIGPHLTFVEAIKLLKVWLKQRNLDNGPGGMTGYVVSMFILYLAQTNKISPYMSSYQVIRTALINIYQNDWCQNGIIFESQNEEHIKNLKLMHQYYQVVFLDPSGNVNLCHSMTKNQFLRIKMEAEHAYKLTESSAINSFEDIFMEKIPDYLFFDEIIKISSLEQILKSLKNSDEITRLESPWYTYETSRAHILECLSRALEERFVLICPIAPPLKSWPINEPQPASQSALEIGILLEDFQNAFKIMNFGPHLGDPEVENFRQFWGENVQLRRFKDGTICESISWIDNENNTTSARRTIIQKIVAYIFKNHLGLDENDYSHNIYLPDRILSQSWDEKICTGEEPFLKLIETFDALGRDMTSLKDLPLPIISVRALSASLRYTEAISMEYANGYDLSWLKDKLNSNDKIPFIRYVHPHEAIINLGTSNKWPTDLDAFLRMKKAFELSIALAIKSQLNLQVRIHTDHFDVYKDGFVFRLNVANSRESKLLRSLRNGRTHPELIRKADQLDLNTIHLPQLASAIRGLQQKYSAYSSCARLAKLWIRSQFIDEHLFSDILIDLLVAYIFVSPGAYQIPKQPQVAFLRFLKLLSRPDLASKAIIVNFDEEMTHEEISQAEALCTSKRRASQGPPLFVATPYDHGGEMWTSHSPSAPILLRIRGLAQKAYEIVLKHLFIPNTSKYITIFRHDTNIYDIILELDKDRVPILSPGVDLSSHIKPASKPGKKLPITGANPVAALVNNLRVHFGELAIFFVNPYTSTHIGIILNKKLNHTIEFKEDHNGKKPKKEPAMDINAIIENIMEMGKDIVISYKTKINVLY